MYRPGVVRTLPFHHTGRASPLLVYRKPHACLRKPHAYLPPRPPTLPTTSVADADDGAEIELDLDLSAFQSGPGSITPAMLQFLLSGGDLRDKGSPPAAVDTGDDGDGNDDAQAGTTAPDARPRMNAVRARH